jgi:hypothetical protein
MPKLSYLKALNRALGDELDRDPDVFLLGEDIRAAGSNLTAGGRPDRRPALKLVLLRGSELDL